MCRLKFLQLATLSYFAVICFAAEEDRYLFLPDPEKCKNRFREAEYNGVNFFFSGHDPTLKDERYDWLDARNTCRERCMETVSFNDEKKFDFFKKYIEKNNITFFWTSGRLCDFAGCEGRWDLLPKIIKAWLWTGIQVQLDPTNKKPKDWSYQPWSHTGHRKVPQPDDAEFFINQIHESCLAILNNMYNDSVAFHDVSCHHKTRFICEDSEPLLEEAKQIELDRLRKIEEDKTSTTTTTQATTTTAKRNTTTKKIAKTVSTTKKLVIEPKIILKNVTRKVETTTTTTTEENTENPEIATEIAEASEIEIQSTTTVTASTTKANFRRNFLNRSQQKESTTKKAVVVDNKKKFIVQRRNSLIKSTIAPTTTTTIVEENIENPEEDEIMNETTTEKIKSRRRFPIPIKRN